MNEKLLLLIQDVSQQKFLLDQTNFANNEWIARLVRADEVGGIICLQR